MGRRARTLVNFRRSRGYSTTLPLSHVCRGGVERACSSISGEQPHPTQARNKLASFYLHCILTEWGEYRRKLSDE